MIKPLQTKGRGGPEGVLRNAGEGRGKNKSNLQYAFMGNGGQEEAKNPMYMA